jgi:HD superfamily phosphohydrolase
MIATHLSPGMDLRAQVTTWLADLDVGVPPLGAKSKHVRDPLLGSIVLAPHEVRLLDTFVMQRLRGIHQLGLAYLTFPSARHSRFEHMLGVRAIAERMLNRLEDVCGPFSREERLTVLSAALLHDCGHGIFSHATESIIDAFPFLRDQYDHALGPLHEQIGGILITEYPIANCLMDAGIDPQAVAALMRHDIPALRQLGVSPALWGIISGPLDADKLDYFARDSYFSGVVLSLDPERIFQTLTLGPNDQLAITLAGASALDQLLYDRVRMYSELYGHQKILAAESMVQALVETMLRRGPNGRRYRIFVRGVDGASQPLSLNRVTDFLRVSDEAFLAAPTDSTVVASLQNRLLRRQLLHAAYTLTFDAVEGVSEVTYLTRLFQIRQPAVLARIRRTLIERLPEISLADLGVNSVRRPKLEGIESCVVGRDGKPVRMGTMFEGWNEVDATGIPTHSVLRHFELYRARISVFCPPEHAERIRPIAREILQAEWGSAGSLL